MTFTELEYVLMLACAVLMWRNASMKLWAKREEHRANKYANWLVGVYKNKGKIVHKDDSYYFEETNQ
jgi:hypothetical protein